MTGITRTSEFTQGILDRRNDPIGIICVSPYFEGSEQDKEWIAGWEYEDDEIWFREYGVNEWHTLNKAALYARITRKQLDELISTGKVIAINLRAWKYRVHGSEIQKIKDSVSQDRKAP